MKKKNHFKKNLGKKSRKKIKKKNQGKNQGKKNKKKIREKIMSKNRIIFQKRKKNPFFETLKKKMLQCIFILSLSKT